VDNLPDAEMKKHAIALQEQIAESFDVIKKAMELQVLEQGPAFTDSGRHIRTLSKRVKESTIQMKDLREKLLERPPPVV